MRIGRTGLAALFLAGCLVALAASQALLGRARHVPAGTVRLEQLAPKLFGGWREVPTAYAIVDPSRAEDRDDLHALYDQVATRTYRRGDGTEVILTLAYRRIQQQESKIHRAELCYFAQGYALSAKRHYAIPTPQGPVPIIAFQGQSSDRNESVLYWIRIGDIVSTSAWQTRGRLFSLGLGGVVPDGMLVRASIVSEFPADRHDIAVRRDVLAEFLASMLAATPPERRWMLTGGSAALAIAKSAS